MKISKVIIPVFVFSTLILLSSFDDQQFLPTKLRITVLDGTGNPVQGAKVKIFTKKEFYLEDKNHIQADSTDKKGKIVFKDLKPIPYYIDARKDDKKNDGGGALTAKLEEGRVNRVNIIIQ